MSIIGSIPASSEGTISRSYVPAMIGFDDGDAFDKIQVTVAGKSQIYVQDADHVTAFIELMQRLSKSAGALDNVLVPVSDGFVGNETFEIVLNNTVAAAKTVWAFSTGKGQGFYTKAGQATLQANDSLFYSGKDFDFILLNEANFDYAQIQFADGHEDKLEPQEIKNLLALKGNTANGEFAGNILGVDNTDGSIEGLTLYTDSGGTCLVTQIILQ